MTGLRGWDPLSSEVLIDTLAIQYGWIMVFALVLGLARGRGTANWYHLPVLFWALVCVQNLRQNFLLGCYYGPGPIAEEFWIVGYQSLLGLCGVCVAQVLGLSISGKPAASLGTTGSRRLAMTSALLAATTDLFLFLWAISPHPGVKYF